MCSLNNSLDRLEHGQNNEVSEDHSPKTQMRILELLIFYIKNKEQNYSLYKVKRIS